MDKQPQQSNNEDNILETKLSMEEQIEKKDKVIVNLTFKNQEMRNRINLLKSKNLQFHNVLKSMRKNTPPSSPSSPNSQFKKLKETIKKLRVEMEVLKKSRRKIVEELHQKEEIISSLKSGDGRINTVGPSLKKGKGLNDSFEIIEKEENLDESESDESDDDVLTEDEEEELLELREKIKKLERTSEQKDIMCKEVLQRVKEKDDKVYDLKKELNSKNEMLKKLQSYGGRKKNEKKSSTRETQDLFSKSSNSNSTKELKDLFSVRRNEDEDESLRKINLLKDRAHEKRCQQYEEEILKVTNRNKKLLIQMDEKDHELVEMKSRMLKAERSVDEKVGFRIAEFESEKKKNIEEVVGYKNRCDKLSAEIDELKENIELHEKKVSSKDDELTSLKKKSEVIQGKLGECLKEKESCEKDNRKLQKEIKVLNINLGTLKSFMKEKMEKVSSLEVLVTSGKEEISKIKEDLNLSNEKLQKEIKEKENVSEGLKVSEEQVRDLRKQIKDKEEELNEKYIKKSSEAMNANEEKAKLLKILSDRNEHVKTLNEEVQTFRNELEIKEKEKESKENEFLLLKKKVNEMEDSLKVKTSEFEELKSEMKKKNDSVLMKMKGKEGELIGALQKCQSKENEILKLKEDGNIQENKLKQLSDKIESLKINLKSSNELKDSLQIKLNKLTTNLHSKEEEMNTFKSNLKSKSEEFSKLINELTTEKKENNSLIKQLKEDIKRALSVKIDAENEVKRLKENMKEGEDDMENKLKLTVVKNDQLLKRVNELEDNIISIKKINSER